MACLKLNWTEPSLSACAMHLFHFIVVLRLHLSEQYLRWAAADCIQQYEDGGALYNNICVIFEWAHLVKFCLGFWVIIFNSFSLALLKAADQQTDCITDINLTKKRPPNVAQAAADNGTAGRVEEE